MPSQLPGAWIIASVVVFFVFSGACTELPEKEPVDEANIKAKLFEPGKISTTAGREFGLTFSPDGGVLYFTRGDEIYWSEKNGNDWSDPQLAEFSKGAWTSDYLEDGAELEYFNYDPVISPDGSTLFIMSHSLVNGKISGEGGTDLWVLDRVGEGFSDSVWSAPRHLGPAVNSPDHTDGALGVSGDGTIYFFSRNREDSLGMSDIYFSLFENGEYQPAINIGPPINTEFWEGHTYSDPDGKFMLFMRMRQPDGFGDCDIYVSHRIDSGWGEPINLGPNVNTEACEMTPCLSPDGKTLVFCRLERAEGDADDKRDIYFIDLEDTLFRKQVQ